MLTLAPLHLLYPLPAHRTLHDAARHPQPPAYSIRLATTITWTHTHDGGWHTPCPTCGNPLRLDPLDVETALHTTAAPTFSHDPDAFLAAWQSTFWLRPTLHRYTHAATAIARFGQWTGRISTDTRTVTDLTVASYLRSTHGLRVMMTKLAADQLIHPGPAMWTLQLPAPGH